eukprot:CAMPEP_0185568818 /NCGR_PEP_ID=MMETSP0434-20130131/1658_1 /TAXON_ID=626734 ORGANISM="Favella taraikaensis, Strain Fe Narragansett Bay" /NCGR_SAMPLE_ID=MMETSP0434 /ASSEMBLY_ACC=CAM_ASM_000379 /LENGTH=139 /DNA_ID=CAMNT_0028183441 /DNA_START=58 /DNA_END=477 /DNA_ORIENTATION=-
MTVCEFLSELETVRLQHLSRWYYHKNIPRLLRNYPIFDGMVHREVYYFNRSERLCKYSTVTRKAVKVANGPPSNSLNKNHIVTTPGANQKVFIINGANFFTLDRQELKRLTTLPIACYFGASVAINERKLVVSGNGQKG